MPINFPKVMRRLDLVDYGPDYAGIGLEVWVNPPREMRTKYWTLLAEAAVISERLSVKQTNEDERKKLVERANEVGRDVTLWMSEILSQGNEETRCTPESLQELADQSPRFYQWIMENVYRLIQEYRTDKKKG